MKTNSIYSTQLLKKDAKNSLSIIKYALMLFLFLNVAKISHAQSVICPDSSSNKICQHCDSAHPAPACNLIGPLVACLSGGADTIQAVIDFSGRNDSLVFSFQENTTGADIVDTNFISYSDSEYIQNIILAPGTQSGSINLQMDVYIRYPDGCLMHCECSKSITIINVSATASFTPILCHGGTDTLKVVGAGGSSYSYTLLPSGPTNSTGIFPGLIAGTYTVTVAGTKDFVTCDASVTTTITQPAPNPVILNCPGNYIVESCQTQASINSQFQTWLNQFSASGGTNPIIRNNLTQNPPDSCVGSVTVYDSVYSACQSPVGCSATFSVTAPPPVALHCANDTSIAAGQSQSAVTAAFNAWLLTANASGGCNGKLSNNANGAPDICTGGTAPVTFTYTASCGSSPSTACTATFTVPSGLPTPSITETDQSGIANNDGIICVGASAGLSTGSYSVYSWSTGATTSSVTVSPTSTTTYTVTVTNANGCSATATSTVVVNPNSSSSTSVTNCNNYVWNGATYTISGTYTFDAGSKSNSVHCDSVATLHLTINYSSTSSTSVTNCDSYAWNGSTYTSSGTHTFDVGSHSNAAGCDSVATLVLTINHSSTSSTSQFVCDSYVWNGVTYTTSGTHTFDTGAHSNAAGCDSVATLVLTVNHSSTSSTSVTNCNSYVWNGATYTSSGTHTFSTTNAAECDSVATLILTISTSSSSSTSITNCDSYVWNGTTYTASGTHTFDAGNTNSHGCDSVATLILTVNHSSTSNTPVTNCDSYAWNGSTYTSSGTHTFDAGAHSNAAGCDSVATLVLTINHSSTSSTPVTNCDSYIWNGTTYTASGTHTFDAGAHSNAAGCDSVATLVLTINHSSTGSASVTNCDSYVWNGATYTSSGTHTFDAGAHSNAAGCDSVATLILTVNHSTTSSISVSSCGSYVWNGTTYTSSGTHTFDAGRTSNSVHCDSVATLILTINPIPNPFITETDNSGVAPNDGIICAGATAGLNAGTFGSYSWSTGATTSAITVTPASTTTYTVTVTNAGCSATATTTVTVNPIPNPSITETDNSGVAPNDGIICAGATAGLNAGTFGSYSWSTGATTSAITVTPASTTTYTVTVTNAGCSATATTTVTVNPIPNPSITETDNSGVAPNDGIICAGATAGLNAGTFGSYSWSTGATTSAITVTPASTTTYTVTVTNAGCSATATTTVTVNPIPNPSITETDNSGVAPNDGIICAGASAGLDVGEYTTYSWSTGATGTHSITVSPSNTTTYTVTVSNAGCYATATITITVNPNPSVTVTTTEGNCKTQGLGTACANPSGGSGSNYTYLWNTNSTMICINVPAGTYSVTVTDGNACKSNNPGTGTVNVNTTPPPASCITPTPLSCSNPCTQIQVNGCTGTGFNYFWSGPSGYTSNSQCPPCVQDSGTYSVTVTDPGNGCTSTCSETVTGAASGYPLTGKCNDSGPVYPNDYFQLTGNPNSNSSLTGDDWDVIYKGTSTTAQAISVGAPGWGGIVQDWPSGPNTDNEFVQGTKDVNDIPDWSWSTHQVPDKDDLLHAGAALYGGHYLYFFSDRYATNGDAQMGLWLFQSGVAPLGTTKGGFSGQHQVGDLLILSDFTNGGGVATLFAYEWVGTGGNTGGTLNSLSLNAVDAYARVNTASVPSPWPYNPKFGPKNVFSPGAFFEGGIDLECVVGNLAGYDLCTFLFETRASQEATAELKDFIFGRVAHNDNGGRMAQPQDNGSGNKNISLHAYPNPFSNITTIEVLPNIDYNNATLDLYDVNGQKIRSLFAGNVVANQIYHFDINAENLSGGIYIYSFKAADEVIFGKVILIK